jgi:hypothetical protein
MQNFKTLRQLLLGELAMSPDRKKEEKKMPFIGATYVYATRQGQRTHSARTNKIDAASLTEDAVSLTEKAVINGQYRKTTL